MVETVRNGQKVWPFCSKCGCRLQIDKDGPKYMLRHYFGKVSWNSPQKEYILHTDAKGCTCEDLALFWIVEKSLVAHIV